FVVGVVGEQVALCPQRDVVAAPRARGEPAGEPERRPVGGGFQPRRRRRVRRRAASRRGRADRQRRGRGSVRLGGEARFLERRGARRGQLQASVGKVGAGKG